MQRCWFSDPVTAISTVPLMSGPLLLSVTCNGVHVVEVEPDVAYSGVTLRVTGGDAACAPNGAAMPARAAAASARTRRAPTRLRPPSRPLDTKSHLHLLRSGRHHNAPFGRKFPFALYLPTLKPGARRRPREMISGALHAAVAPI